MSESTSNHDDVITMFDTMWGLHPSPVMLIKANRDILAVNDVGKSLGIPMDIKCFSLTGKNIICDGCKGNAAIKENSAQRACSWQDKLNMFADTYWIPVRGHKGIFVHFGNDITAFVKDELCKPE